MKKQAMAESNSEKLLLLKANLGAHAARLVEGPGKENPPPHSEEAQEIKKRKAAQKRARRLERWAGQNQS